MTNYPKPDNIIKHCKCCNTLTNVVYINYPNAFCDKCALKVNKLHGLYKDIENRAMQLLKTLDTNATSPGTIKLGIEYLNKALKYRRIMRTRYFNGGDKRHKKWEKFMNKTLNIYNERVKSPEIYEKFSNKGYKIPKNTILCSKTEIISVCQSINKLHHK